MKDLTSLANSFGIKCYDTEEGYFIPSDSQSKLSSVLNTLGLDVVYGEEGEIVTGPSQKIDVIQVIVKKPDLAGKIFSFWKRNFGKANFEVPQYPDKVLESKLQGLHFSKSPGDNFWDAYKARISIIASHLYLAEGAVIHFVKKTENNSPTTALNEDAADEDSDGEDVA